MAPAEASPELFSVTVEDYVFAPSVRPPSSDKVLFLGGAGVRGLPIEGNYVTFTATGIYLDVEAALRSLAPRWKGKSADELAQSVEFYRDIVTGPYEKFIQVTMIKLLTGEQFSTKVVKNCVAIMKAIGTYTDVEEKATEKFLEIFKDESISPGSSVFFKQTPIGSLMIAFGKHDVIPEVGNVVIENKLMSQSFFESIIGKNDVSPATSKSLANRVHEMLSAYQVPNGKDETKENGEVTKV